VNLGSHPPLGASTVRKTRTALAFVLFPFFSDAQPFDTRTAGKPWAQGSATVILPDAGPVWRTDGDRESREDRNFWRNYRGKVKARLLAVEQARTARVISAARARAAAFSAFETRKQNGSPAGDAPLENRGNVLFPAPEGWPTGSGALSQTAATAKRHIDTAATTARNTAQSLARTIEGNLPGTKNSTTKTASVIIALLAIFVAPAALLTIAGLGLLRLRKRQR
jgi:hypothetical protein